MTLDLSVILSLLALACVAAVLFVLLRQSHDQSRLRLLVEQALAGQRSDGDSIRLATQSATADMAARLAALHGEMNTGIETLRTVLSREQGELRLALAQGEEQAQKRITIQFETTRLLLETKLAEIQRGVNEQLNEAVEKQMKESFSRVIDQFAAVQKAMGDVQAVTAQIGDIKRLFSNVKTRGGWGETQVRAMLDDILPVGAYETNRKIRPDSDESVEFAVIMPMRGENRPVLPIDAKFPVEDYERLLAASDAGDAEAERIARRGLERRIRDEARKIATKYIFSPVTVEFAILYLPTDALYIEVARIPGLIDEIGRVHRVVILGPSLFPALLRTIHLGFVTVALEQKAEEIRGLLGATRTEMLRMDDILDRLLKQAGSFANTIEQARRRTRVMGRKLRAVEVMDPAQAEQLLELDSPDLAEELSPDDNGEPES
jgi:DNA recombination protein RmuC